MFKQCYPFHPATLSVFQKKWQSLTQFQQTRGTLAMLAQWISGAYKEGYANAREEALITLGSAPLENKEFKSVVLGQLGESRLLTAIDTDVAGEYSHAKSLDVDSNNELKDLHQRVGKAIFFQCSGGQSKNISTLPELRYSIGEPGLDTTSIDVAAQNLFQKSFYIKKEGADGFRISYKATLKKIVNDKKASLDEDRDINPAIESMIKEVFDEGRVITAFYFPKKSIDISDSPKITLVIMHPDTPWDQGNPEVTKNLVLTYTKTRDESDRLFPGALIWCFKKDGSDLRDKTITLLAWQRVKEDVDNHRISDEFEEPMQNNIDTNISNSLKEALEEVKASYRYVIVPLLDKDDVQIIDLGTSTFNETLSGRVVSELISKALLIEKFAASYIDRSWPPALLQDGAWPLASIRQAFLNGSLTRLMDPEKSIPECILKFIKKGDFGLGSIKLQDGGYKFIWYKDPKMNIGDISFDPKADNYLLRKEIAIELKKSLEELSTESRETSTEEQEEIGTQEPEEMWAQEPEEIGAQEPEEIEAAPPEVPKSKITMSGEIVPEIWQRFATSIIPKLKSGDKLKIQVMITTQIDQSKADALVLELNKKLKDMGASKKLKVQAK